MSFFYRDLPIGMLLCGCLFVAWLSYCGVAPAVVWHMFVACVFVSAWGPVWAVATETLTHHKSLAYRVAGWVFCIVGLPLLIMAIICVAYKTWSASTCN